MFFFIISCFFINIFLLFVIPSKSQFILKSLTLFLNFFYLIITVLIWVFFDYDTSGFFFIYNIPILENYNIFCTFGIDGISLFFLLLTVLLFPICFLASWDVKKSKLLFLNLLLIEFLLFLTFSVLDLFFFCIFFESLLIPMFFIIILWGTRARRVRALTYFFLYTLFGSVFLLLLLFFLFFEINSFHFLEIIFSDFDVTKQKIIWFALFIVFAIKIPIFPFYIWLPEAHVEAPTVGSIILAGLLLKIGGYGILRFLLIFEYAKYYYQPFIFIFCFLSIWLASIIAVRQVDLKKIIAYSSIAHMNFALLGYFSNSIYGILGGVLLMLSHGIVSSALFFLVGVLYSRYHSRLLYYYGGLMQVMPLFGFFFIIFIFSNFSFPGTSNFIGEIFVLFGLAKAEQWFLLILVFLSTFLTVLYSLILVLKIIFGSFKLAFIQTFTDLSQSEVYALFPLFIFNLIIGLGPGIFLPIIYFSIKNIYFTSMLMYNITIIIKFFFWTVI